MVIITIIMVNIDIHNTCYNFVVLKMLLFKLNIYVSIIITAITVSILYQCCQ